MDAEYRAAQRQAQIDPSKENLERFISVYQRQGKHSLFQFLDTSRPGESYPSSNAQQVILNKRSLELAPLGYGARIWILEAIYWLWSEGFIKKPLVITSPLRGYDKNRLTAPRMFREPVEDQEAREIAKFQAAFQVVSYSIFSTVELLNSTLQYDLIWLDEAQKIRNRKTLRARQVTELIQNQDPAWLVLHSGVLAHDRHSIARMSTAFDISNISRCGQPIERVP